MNGFHSITCNNASNPPLPDAQSPKGPFSSIPAIIDSGACQKIIKIARWIFEQLAQGMQWILGKLSPREPVEILDVHSDAQHSCHPLTTFVSATFDQRLGHLWMIDRLRIPLLNRCFYRKYRNLTYKIFTETLSQTIEDYTGQNKDSPEMDQLRQTLVEMNNALNSTTCKNFKFNQWLISLFKSVLGGVDGGLKISLVKRGIPVGMVEPFLYLSAAHLHAAHAGRGNFSQDLAFTFIKGLVKSGAPPFPTLHPLLRRTFRDMDKSEIINWLVATVIRTNGGAVDRNDLELSRLFQHVSIPEANLVIRHISPRCVGLNILSRFLVIAFPNNLRTCGEDDSFYIVANHFFWGPWVIFSINQAESDERVTLMYHKGSKEEFLDAVKTKFSSDSPIFKLCRSLVIRLHHIQTLNWTPLHWAVFTGRVTSARSLLGGNINVSAVDNEGHSLLDALDFGIHLAKEHPLWGQELRYEKECFRQTEMLLLAAGAERKKPFSESTQPTN